MKILMSYNSQEPAWNLPDDIGTLNSNGYSFSPLTVLKGSCQIARIELSRIHVSYQCLFYLSRLCTQAPNKIGGQLFFLNNISLCIENQLLI